jgi:hypothetical protein
MPTGLVRGQSEFEFYKKIFKELSVWHHSLTILSPTDIGLLKELKVAGERGQTTRTFRMRLVLDRLAKDGYVSARSTVLELVHYRITRRGPDAIPNHI